MQEAEPLRMGRTAYRLLSAPDRGPPSRGGTLVLCLVRAACAIHRAIGPQVARMRTLLLRFARLAVLLTAFAAGRVLTEARCLSGYDAARLCPGVLHRGGRLGSELRSDRVPEGQVRQAFFERRPPRTRTARTALWRLA